MSCICIGFIFNSSFPSLSGLICSQYIKLNLRRQVFFNFFLILDKWPVMPVYRLTACIMSHSCGMKEKMPTRDKARWTGIIVGAVSMILGLFYREPLSVFGHPVTDNVFMAVGALVMLVTFGAIQSFRTFWRRK
jgi:hypothetical protein